MTELWPELVLVGALVVINAVLAGSEIALISLRESQLNRLEREGGAGEVVARLARDPNRFLATIQIGITLSGFLASAAAAVTLAEPLVPYLGVFGNSADTVAIVLVTLILSFFTLVLGELAPKRLALQRAEGWALLVGRPLHLMSIVSKPVVVLLSMSTDVVVRILGGRPGAVREEVDLEELRDMVIANRVLREDHQDVLLGAFEVAERLVGEVMTPRPDVDAVEAGSTTAQAIDSLVLTGHTRAPVIPADGMLDQAIGIVNLIDLVRADPDANVEVHASEATVFPESVLVLSALRRLQENRQQMALVVDEFGGVSGIITVEDLIEEVVGEIYDESDRDVVNVRRQPDGSLLVPGRFPVHDLVDIGIDAPAGEFRTVAGLVLQALGRVAHDGDRVTIGAWTLTVEETEGRAISMVRFAEATGDEQIDG